MLFSGYRLSLQTKPDTSSSSYTKVENGRTQFHHGLVGFANASRQAANTYAEPQICHRQTLALEHEESAPVRVFSLPQRHELEGPRHSFHEGGIRDGM
jgi:hypothetical protein